MVGWHHRLNGHGFEQALGDSEGHMEAWCAAVHGGHKEQLTTITFAIFYPLKENHRSCPHSRAGDNSVALKRGIIGHLKAC